MPDAALDREEIADGARDNWSFLGGETLPAGVEVLDFYHAAEHLNRARMRYAEIATKNLPIGSGIIEAACKTLSSRHKRSGMRWRTSGGQAIFTLRALIQSDRFDSAWALTSTRSQPTQWIGACSARTSVVQATQTFISMATAIVKSRALNERLFTRAEPAGCGTTTR